MGPQTYVQCKIFKNTLTLNSLAHVDCSTLMQQFPMQRGLLHVWGDCSVSKVHIVQAWGPEFEPCVKQWRIVAQSRAVRRQRWLDPWESLNSRCAPCSVRDAVSHNRMHSKTGLWLPQGHMHMYLHTYEYMQTRMHMHLHVYEYVQTYTCNNKNIITCFIHSHVSWGNVVSSDEILDSSLEKSSSLSMVLVGAQVMTFKCAQFLSHLGPQATAQEWQGPLNLWGEQHSCF